MSFRGFKRMLVGEQMPDKNDPKYKERYERDKAAGAKFARMTGLVWLGQHYVGWAEKHKKLFFFIMLSTMTLFALTNIYRLCSQHVNAVAVERQRSTLIEMQGDKAKVLDVNNNNKGKEK